MYYLKIITSAACGRGSKIEQNKTKGIWLCFKDVPKSICFEALIFYVAVWVVGISGGIWV